MNRHQRRAAAKSAPAVTTSTRPAAGPDPAAAAAAALAIGDLEAAEAGFKAALKRDDRTVEAHHGLGSVALRRGAMADAEAAYRRAIALDPTRAGVWLELGLAVGEQDRKTEALELFRRARTLAPKLSPAWLYEGMTAEILGSPRAAAEAFQRVVELGGARADTHLRLARALNGLGRVVEAETAARAALAAPEDAPGQHLDAEGQLALALHRMARFDDAETVLRGIIARVPEIPGAAGALAHIARDRGRHREAAELYRREVELAPHDPRMASNLVFALAGGRLLDPAGVLEAARDWAVRYAPEPATPAFRLTDRRPDRPLTIGYVSPDFRNHPVAAFMTPVLTARDRESFRVIGYSLTEAPDSTTDHVAGLCDLWRTGRAADPEALAQRVAEDGVDILVDLAGHSGDHGLRIFAPRPAPIQATYLGYFATTGLSQMDYWITDAVLHPEDTIERASETIHRLPRCWMAWTPPDGCPEVTLRPADGPLVFGSFNGMNKFTDATADLWASVLRAVPDSRFLMKTWALHGGRQRAEISSAFALRGVDPARLELRTIVPDPLGHLASYGEIDIGLDPVPYTGATTTTEALWMGVPVLTLAGEVMVDRMSASLLTAVGMSDWIAASPEDLVARAKNFAADRAGLARLRASQRTRFAASPLADGPGLARALEAAYRSMWRRRVAAP